MKSCSPELAAYLASRPRNIIAPACFTITLADGTEIRFTDADVPVQVDSVVFAANSIRISGLKSSLKVGLDVDEQTVTIIAKETDLLEGVPFLTAIQAGALDDATITRDRAYLPAWYQPAIGSLNSFYGSVSTIDKVGRTSAQIKVKSDLRLLDIDYPRNLWQPTCGWTLFGYGCAKNKADYAHNGAVGAGATLLVLPWSGAGAGAFDQGTLTFTDGVLNGVSVSIASSDGTNLTLQAPLPELPSAGDTFTAYWGCDHTKGNGGCAKFNNLARFRGFPFVPQVETGI